MDAAGLRDAERVWFVFYEKRSVVTDLLEEHQQEFVPLEPLRRFGETAVRLYLHRAGGGTPGRLRPQELSPPLHLQGRMARNRGVPLMGGIRRPRGRARLQAVLLDDLPPWSCAGCRISRRPR